MAELTVDMTYGTALYEAASELDKTEQIASEAEQVLAIMEQEPDLRAFVNYPAISAEEKKKTLKTIFEGQITEELMNFMFVLIDKRTRHVGAARQRLDHAKLSRDIEADDTFARPAVGEQDRLLRPFRLRKGVVGAAPRIPPFGDAEFLEIA